MIGIGSLRIGLTRINWLVAQIAALYASAQPGAWYDQSDFATMYQDSAGTTPGTTVGQPVGLRLDKRLGLVRGPEVCTDPGLNTPASWNVTGGTAPLWVVSGGLAVVSATSAGNRWLNNIGGALVVGKTYEITADVVVTAGACGPDMDGFTQDVTTSGAKRWVLKAATTTIGFIARATFIGSMDNISVKLLDGNHLTQATAASRPLVQIDGNGKYYDAFDGVDDSMSSATGGGATTGFFWCGAVKPTGGAGTQRYLVSDHGTNSGYILFLNGTDSAQFGAGNATSYMTVSSAGAASVGSTALVTAWDDGTNLNVQLGSGAVVSVARPVVVAGTAGFTIGKDNVSAGAFFPGNIYASVYRTGTPVTAAERANIQAYVMQKAGL